MWIQVEDTVRDHDKIFKLADILEISDAHAVGLMVCLWLWTSVNAPDGDLSQFPPRAIAAAAKWEGGEEKNAGFFCSALLESRLLESPEEGKWMIRNWDKRQGMAMSYLERQREKTNERVRKYRERKKKEKLSEEKTAPQKSNVTETLPETDVTPLPNLTLPNQTKPDLTIPNPSSPAQPAECQGQQNGQAQPSEDGQEAALRRVCEAFSRAIHVPKSKEQAQLRLLLRQYGEPVLLAAVEDARGKGKSVNYLGTILKRWQQEGLPAKKVGKTAERPAPSFDLEEYERMTGWPAAGFESTA